MEPIILGTNNNLNSTSLPVTRLGFSLNKLLAVALSYEDQKSDLKASTITFHNQHHIFFKVKCKFEILLGQCTLPHITKWTYKVLFFLLHKWKPMIGCSP